MLCWNHQIIDRNWIILFCNLAFFHCDQLFSMVFLSKNGKCGCSFDLLVVNNFTRANNDKLFLIMQHFRDKILNWLITNIKRLIGNNENCSLQRYDQKNAKWLYWNSVNDNIEFLPRLLRWHTRPTTKASYKMWGFFVFFNLLMIIWHHPIWMMSNHLASNAGNFSLATGQDVNFISVSSAICFLGTQDITVIPIE